MGKRLILAKMGKEIKAWDTEDGACLGLPL